MSQQALGARRFVERTGQRRPGSGDGHVVAAGKGGVGTSTAALLLAFSARAWGPVVLVDARGGFGGLGHLLGLDDPAAPEPDDTASDADRADSGEGPDRSTPSIRETELGPDMVLVHGDARLDYDAPGDRSALRRAARGHVDATVIVDAGSRPRTVVRALGDFGTSLVTVMGADGVSPAAGYALARLAWRTRPDTRLAVLANEVTEAEAGLIHDAVRSAAARFAHRAIEWLGHLPAAPSLVDPRGIPWGTLDRAEPALMAAATAAAGRLVVDRGTIVNNTLQLLK